MIPSQAGDIALEIESARRFADGDGVVVELAGKWRGRGRAPHGRELLIVEAEGRNHRFPALPELRRRRIGSSRNWSARFALPGWLAPELEGGLSLLIGQHTIPIAALEAAEPAGALGPGAIDPARPSASAGSAGSAGPVGSAPAVERAGAADPDEVSELLSGGERLAHTVAALRAELHERAVAEGRARGKLAELQSQLEAQRATQARLEAAQVELRRELAELLETIQSERARRAEAESEASVRSAKVRELQEHISSLQVGLSEAGVARQAALAEVAGLRGEVQRLGAELAVERKRAAAASEGLGEARSLLSEVRALNARLGAEQEGVAGRGDAGFAADVFVGADVADRSSLEDLTSTFRRS